MEPQRNVHVRGALGEVLAAARGGAAASASRRARKLSPVRTAAASAASPHHRLVPSDTVEPARHNGVPTPAPSPLTEPARHSTETAQDAATARQKWRMRAMSPANPADLSDAISPVDDPDGSVVSGRKVAGKRVARSAVGAPAAKRAEAGLLAEKPWRRGRGSARASLF